MSPFSSYYAATLRLPLQHISRQAAVEVYREMQRRRPEALLGAPPILAEYYQEALYVGMQLSLPTEQEGQLMERWIDAMRSLEEVLSLQCTYDLRRWLVVFGGLRKVFEAEARRRSVVCPKLAQQPDANG